MHNSNDTADAENRERDTPDDDQGRSDRVSELEAANADLRDRVSELESIVDEIAPGASPGTRTRNLSDDSSGARDSDRRSVLPSGGQAHKVMGKFEESNGGVGVYGHNTAGSGATYGIWGEVDSPTGYGLYTPNAALIEGDLQTNNAIDMDPDNDNSGTDLFMGDNSKLYYNPDFFGISIIGIANCDEFRLSAGTAGVVFENAGTYIKFEDGTEQRTAGPVAKGVISSSGSVVNSVGISGATYYSLPEPNYDVEFSTIDYDHDEYVAVVTPVNSPASVETGMAGSNPKNLVVSMYDDTGTAIQSKFHVAVYEATAGASTVSNLRDSTAQASTSSSGADGD